MFSFFKKSPVDDETPPHHAEGSLSPDGIIVEVDSASPPLDPGVGSEAFRLPSKGKLPSCQELMSHNPAKFGFLEKENSSIISKCLNRWKKRYFVLIGGFLFRYTDPQGARPKGVPIPLDSVQINKHSELQCFEVVTIRKVYILKAASDDEADEWIQAIRDRKSLSIAEGMGHRQVSVAVGEFNKRATKAFEKTVKKEATMIDNPMHDTFSAAMGVPSM
jgi:hypothetical protein